MEVTACSFSEYQCPWMGTLLMKARSLHGSGSPARMQAHPDSGKAMPPNVTTRCMLFIELFTVCLQSLYMLDDRIRVQDDIIFFALPRKQAAVTAFHALFLRHAVYQWVFSTVSSYWITSIQWSDCGLNLYKKAQDVLEQKDLCCQPIMFSLAYGAPDQFLKKTANDLYVKSKALIKNLPIKNENDILVILIFISHFIISFINRLVLLDAMSHLSTAYKLINT